MKEKYNKIIEKLRKGERADISKLSQFEKIEFNSIKGKKKKEIIESKITELSNEHDVPVPDIQYGKTKKERLATHQRKKGEISTLTFNLQKMPFSDLNRVAKHEFKHYLEIQRTGKTKERTAEVFATGKKFQLGEKVHFEHEGKTYKGWVKRRNPRRISVKLKNPERNPLGKGAIVLIPYRMLEKGWKL